MPAGAEKRFHRPVIVQLGRIDRDRVVSTPKEAAEILRRDWRAADSPERLRAMAACLLVLRGEKPPSYARKAFIRAAQAARVYIEDGSADEPSD